MLIEKPLGEAPVLVVFSGTNGRNHGKVSKPLFFGNLLGFFYEFGTESVVLGFFARFFTDFGHLTIDVDFTNDGRVVELRDEGVGLIGVCHT